MATLDTPADLRPTVGAVFLRLLCDPFGVLAKNWKSAVLSSLVRAAIFFSSIFPPGLYGELTEAFREAEPPSAATLAVALLLPVATHGLVFLVDWLGGTRKFVMENELGEPQALARLAGTRFHKIVDLFRFIMALLASRQMRPALRLAFLGTEENGP